MWPVPGPRVLLEPYLIGGKAPTLDYIVYLLDASGHRSGPFFFVQGKTTDQRPQPGDPYPIKFAATDVDRAIATNYIVSCDLRKGRGGRPQDVRSP